MALQTNCLPSEHIRGFALAPPAQAASKVNSLGSIDGDLNISDALKGMDSIKENNAEEDKNPSVCNSVSLYSFSKFSFLFFPFSSLPCDVLGGHNPISLEATEIRDKQSKAQSEMRCIINMKAIVFGCVAIRVALPCWRHSFSENSLRGIQAATRMRMGRHYSKRAAYRCVFILCTYDTDATKDVECKRALL